MITSLCLQLYIFMRTDGWITVYLLFSAKLKALISLILPGLKQGTIHITLTHHSLDNKFFILREPQPVLREEHLVNAGLQITGPDG